jgi:hypothetical protein
MILDKFNWLRIKGHWFGLFGLANLLCFGAHFLTTPDWYNYHFSYTTYPARMFKSLKTMVGSDNFLNVAWTAPTLLLCDFYMHRKVGSLVMTKFFFLSFMSTFMFWSAVNPESGLNI